MGKQQTSATVANGLEYAEARAAYREDCGWVLCGRPVEGEGEQRQARLDLKATGLIAVDVPGAAYYGHEHLPALAGVLELGAPAFSSAGNDGRVTLLFAAPDLPDGAVRRLVLDTSLGVAAAAYRAGADRRNPALPCADSPERWIHLPQTAPTAPTVLTSVAAALVGDRSATDAAVVAWLRDHFEPSGSTGIGGFVKRAKGDPVIGLSRREIHDLLCQVTGWTSTDFPEERLSLCCSEARFTSHRTTGGYKYLIQRRADVPLRKPAGVSVETIDGTLLELCRAMHITREHSPERKRQRAEESELARARAAEAAFLREHYGNAETRDMLLQMQSVPGHFGATTYAGFHVQAEQRRQTACLAAALEYVPLPFVSSTPEWWATSGGPDTPHDVRYRRIVARFAQPKAEVA